MKTLQLKSVIISTLVFLCISANSNAQTKSSSHPLLDKISSANGELVDQSAVIAKLQSTAYVFIGEKHDNPEHHRIEQALIKARFQFAAQEQQGNVVFEMLDDSQDNAIAQLKTTDSIEEMFATLKWPVKGWDWSAYSPQFKAALENKALKSGNISKAFIGPVYREGEAILKSDPRFSSALVAPINIKNYLLDQIFDAHCGMQSKETLTPMLNIQLAKDASMASAMLKTPAAILIAGGEHVKAETAVPWHVLQKQPKAKTLVIQLIEVKVDQPDPKAYFTNAGKADYYWFTSATPEKDYCADVKGKAAK
jgi:uncharacterized iron-regulated protein